MFNEKTVAVEEQEVYYDQARGWEADKAARIEKSERRAWLVAVGASTIAIAAVIGISILAPFRHTVPYLFALDRATGNVEYVSAVDDRAVRGYQELLDKHWAEKYVIARESYYYKLLQADYDTVLRLSSDNVGRDFAMLYEGQNARDKKYGPDIEMKVSVISVQLSQNDVGTNAVVRFSKSTRRVDGDSNDAPQYYVATLAYEYKPSMLGQEKDLIANPLGYRVTSYRADSEMSPVITPTAEMTITPKPVVPAVSVTPVQLKPVDQ